MKEIRSYILPSIIAISAFYFLFLAITLRINAEAEAQTCFLMPHFYRFDITVGDQQTQEWPGHNDHNSFCGVRVINMGRVNHHGTTNCSVYLSGNPARWTFTGYAPNGDISQCSFVCVGWN
jgi:hypothetical protein